MTALIGIGIGIIYCAFGYAFSCIFGRLFDDWDEVSEVITLFFWPFVIVIVMCGLILQAIKELWKQ